MSWGPAKADKRVARFVVFGCLGPVLSCVDEPGRTPGTLTDCDACHGEDGNSAPPADVGGNTATTLTGIGAHRSHTDVSTWHATVACDECHAVPTLLLDAGHMDTTLPAEVTFGTLSQADGAAPAWNGTACSGSYCHGETLTGGTNTTPAWTTVDGTQAACGACHGLPPDSPHISSNLCGDCHAAVADNTPAIVDGTLHINGTIDYDISSAPCDACHGESGDPAPPVDVGGNSATTLTGVGAHREHTDSATWHATVACNECHVVPASPMDAGHLDGTMPAEVTFGPLANADGASPAWDGTTCSTGYCHGATLDGGSLTAPNWTTVDGTQDACGACHGLPPGVPHVPSNQCGDCHSTVADSTPQIIDPALHINGTVNIDPMTCASCHGGGVNPAPPVDVSGNSATTFTGVGAHREHTDPSTWHATVTCAECHVVPSAVGDAGHKDTTSPAELMFGALSQADGATPAWDGAVCSGSYCHGGTLDGGSLAAPTWTTVDGTQDACGTCHGLPPGGAHVADNQCGNCHSAVADSTPAIVDAALHINGTVETDALACNACHGSGTNDAPPVDTSGNSPTTFTGVGAHQAHLVPDQSAVVACTECHVVPAAESDPGHTDTSLPAELTFGALADADGVTSTWTDPTCSTYCHGASLNGGSGTAPVWTTVDGTQDECGDCHGLPPGAGHVNSAQCGNCHSPVADSTPAITTAAQHVDGTVDSPTACDACHGSATNAAPPTDLDGTPVGRGVGAHQAHLTSTALRDPAVGCGECHTVPAARDDAGHIDNNMPAEVDFTGSALGSGTVWNGGTTTCSNTYCHGDTLNGGSATSPDWSVADGSQKQCDSCHGSPPGGGHANDPNCGDCHSAVADNTPAILDATLHINGTVQTDALACNTCHGSVTNDAPPVDTSGNSATAFTGVGAHQSHLAPDESAAVACGQCHMVPAAVGDAGHMDGTMPAEVTFGALANADGASPAWNGTVCSTSYCHGGTLDGGSLTTPTWTTVDGTQDACGTCHGLPPNPPHSTSNQCSVCHAAVADNVPQIVDGSLHINGTVTYDISAAACALCHITPASGSHAAHVTTLGYACTRCHDGYPSSPNHYNGSSETAGLTAFDAGNPGGTYNEGASSCGNLWCHGPNSVSADPVWGGATPGCGECHPVPPTVGSHAVHTGNDFSDPAAPEYDFACGECHNGVNTAVPHVDFAVDVTLDSGAAALATGYGANGGNTPTWNAGPRTCSDVYCHSNGVTKEKGGAYDLGDIGSPPDGTLAYNTPVWGGALSCGDCHAGATLGTTLLSGHYPTTGEHQKGQHSDNPNGKARQNYVPCAQCHSTPLRDALQGTYGSAQHADGALDFHPYRYGIGAGTIQNLTAPDPPSNYLDRSYHDTDKAHCGNGKSCWY